MSLIVILLSHPPQGTSLNFHEASWPTAHRVELAARHRLPAVYAFRNMAVEGGLMSYGVDVAGL
jgi:hypothetical protein